jgi:hypothetical protein
MSEKLKNFLRCKIEELKGEIVCFERKSLAIKIIHGCLLFISISSAAVVTIIAPLGVTAVTLALVAAISTISTATILKCQFKKKREKVSHMIKQLNVLKDRLDFVVQCNGSLTDEECNNMLQQFREGF